MFQYPSSNLAGAILDASVKIFYSERKSLSGNKYYFEVGYNRFAISGKPAGQGFWKVAYQIPFTNKQNDANGIYENWFLNEIIWTT